MSDFGMMFFIGLTFGILVTVIGFAIWIGSTQQ